MAGDDSAELPSGLARWQAGRTAAPPFAAPSGPAAAPSGKANYSRTVIEGECARVREAVQGTRNAALNTAALKLGRLVAGGHSTEDEVRAELTHAAADAGLGPIEAAKTISSGLRKGLQHPRDAGPMQNTGATAGGDVVDITERVAAAAAAGGGVVVVQQQAPQPAALDLSTYLVPGGSYLLELPDVTPAIWGKGDQVLWAEGEALMIAGGQGLGKTTIAGQLVRGRLGLVPTVLELPVAEGGTVLWLMMDRPRQQARSARRHFTRDELEHLDAEQRLMLGIGPPPQDIARHPDLLAELCAAAKADTVVVDSLKDAAIGLTDDEVGAGYNRARQLAVAAGVQVLELHHLVKRGVDGKAPSTLADVYGSTWLTSGVGSVLLLTGDAGDPIIRASHLKQPHEQVGPLTLAHDHTAGITSVYHRVDVLELLAVTQVQTAESCARAMFETEKPTRAEKERARRKLEELVRTGHAWSQPGRPGGEGGGGSTRYHPAGKAPTDVTDLLDPDLIDPEHDTALED